MCISPSLSLYIYIYHNMLCASFKGCRIECYRKDVPQLSKWKMPFAHLKAHMMAKSNNDESYSPFLSEIEKVAAEQETFVNTALQFVCECEVVDKAQDTLFPNRAQCECLVMCMLVSMFLQAQVHPRSCPLVWCLLLCL